VKDVARIKVDQGRRIGEADPRIYSGFIEHRAGAQKLTSRQAVH